MTVRKTAEGRTISGFKMKLYPGFAEEYERRHNELWPEMADMLHEYGGHNYSIFITRPISAVILIITVVLLVSMIRVNRRVAKLNEQQEAEMAAAHAEND